MLRNLLERLSKAGVGISFANLKEKILDVFDRTGLCEMIGKENIYPSVGQAITALKQKVEIEEETPESEQEPHDTMQDKKLELADES